MLHAINLDLIHSVYFLCDILCLRFSYILMTHAAAPRSACTFAQARPTMSCIRLVTYPEVGISAGRAHMMHGIMQVILSPAQLPHVTPTSTWVRQLGGHTHCAQHLITAWSAGPTRAEYHTGESEMVGTGRESTTGDYDQLLLSHTKC